MNQAVRVQFDVMRSLAFGDISGAFALVGTAFDHPVRLLILQNFTNVQVIFSFDGTNNHITLPSGGQVVLDFASDASAVAGMWSLAVGDSVWAKDNGTGAASGSVYVSASYGKGE